MSNGTNEVDSYMEALSPEEQDWMNYFIGYMREKHPDLEEVISFGMPTYKLGSGKQRNYISFFPAKNHLSMHTMDFAYISLLKNRLSAPGKGKGCVKVTYKNPEERTVLLEAIEEIIERQKQVMPEK